MGLNGVCSLFIPHVLDDEQIHKKVKTPLDIQDLSLSFFVNIIQWREKKTKQG